MTLQNVQWVLYTCSLLNFGVLSAFYPLKVAVVNNQVHIPIRIKIQGLKESAWWQIPHDLVAVAKAVLPIHHENDMLRTDQHVKGTIIVPVHRSKVGNLASPIQ